MASMLAGMGGMAGLQQMMGGMGGMPAFNPEGAADEPDEDDGGWPEEEMYPAEEEVSCLLGPSHICPAWLRTPACLLRLPAPLNPPSSACSSLLQTCPTWSRAPTSRLLRSKRTQARLSRLARSAPASASTPCPASAAWSSGKPRAPSRGAAAQQPAAGRARGERGRAHAALPPRRRTAPSTDCARADTRGAAAAAAVNLSLAAARAPPAARQRARLSPCVAPGTPYPGNVGIAPPLWARL